MESLIDIQDKNTSYIVFRVHKEEKQNNEAEHIFKLSKKIF